MRAGLLLQRVHQARDRAVQILVGPAQLFDLVDGVQDGSVVLAAELAPDLRQRGGGELLHDIHRYLAWKSDGPRVAANLQVLLAQIEVLAHAFLDQVDGDALFLRSDDVPEHLLRRRQRTGSAGQRSIRHQARQRAFQFAYVGFDCPRNIFRNVVRQAEAFVLRFFLQNGDLSLEIRRLDVRDQSPLKPRAKPLLDGIDVLRQAVRGDNDLLLLLVERVEGVKKFFLRPLFSGDELDIVDQQNVDRVETVAEADHAVEAQRIDHFDRELFRADVTEPHRRIAPLDGVTDGVHQMSLAHAHSAIQEQRVVGFGRLLGDGACRGMREFVGLADDEGVESVARVELVVAALKIQLGLLHAGNHGSRLGRLFLGSHVMYFCVWRAELMKHGFDDVAIGARQDLPEHGAGYLDIERVALSTVQARGLEPGRIRIDADAGLDALKKLVPGIRHFASSLDCSRHRKRKENPVLFPQM